MESSKTYTINMTSEQRNLFDKWLNEAEKELETKLESIKSLRNKIKDKTSGSTLIIKSKGSQSANLSWTSKTVNALKQLGSVQTSAAVISWLMNNDDGSQNKNKRYITKIVTSKLSLLVDKGRIKKKVIDGKNFYSLENPD